MTDIKCRNIYCLWNAVVAGHGVCKKDEIEINDLYECDSREYIDDDEEEGESNV